MMASWPAGSCRSFSIVLDSLACISFKSCGPCPSLIQPGLHFKAPAIKNNVSDDMFGRLFEACIFGNYRLHI